MFADEGVEHRVIAVHADRRAAVNVGVVGRAIHEVNVRQIFGPYSYGPETLATPLKLSSSPARPFAACFGAEPNIGPLFPIDEILASGRLTHPTLNGRCHRVPLFRRQVHAD